MPKICSLCFLLLIFLALPTRAADVITPAQAAEGWIALFDGVSLFGWQLTTRVNVDVKDGEIRINPEEPGWLMTTTEFADYELHVEVQGVLGTNSGIFLRTPLEPKDPTSDCYELNIAHQDNPFPTGSLVGRIKAKHPALSHMINAGWEVPADVFDIRVEGDTITVVMNEGTPLIYRDPNPIRTGHIGLQFKEGSVAFRNIRLKPLNLKPIFSGKDLSEWKTELAGTSEFAVTAQHEIAVKNGPGQLETRDSYGDFIMQLDCKVNGEGLNSGIFFRCIPGDKLMGYESQIHNGMKDGDPRQPLDAGTGAIYRRTIARKIIAKDNEWFTKTIVADGPHMAVGVNGIQVTDWIDERPADENPRKGLRTKAGTIAIQGHDPTTDLLFRNLKITELPK